MKTVPKIDQSITPEKASLISPLTLAFVGDAVYSLMVRSEYCLSGDFKSGELTKKSNSTVSAVSQSRKVREILPLLTEEELGVFKRARNAKIHNYPAHATQAEYREASGFEAVIGYLYLTGQSDRLGELLGENDAN